MLPTVTPNELERLRVENLKVGMTNAVMSHIFKTFLRYKTHKFASIADHDSSTLTVITLQFRIGTRQMGYEFVWATPLFWCHTFVSRGLKI